LAFCLEVPAGLTDKTSRYFVSTPSLCKANALPEVEELSVMIFFEIARASWLPPLPESVLRDKANELSPGTSPLALSLNEAWPREAAGASPIEPLTDHRR
jgi:hypothetical protein